MASFVFEGIAEAFIFCVSASEILANRFSGFSAFLFGKAIVILLRAVSAVTFAAELLQRSQSNAVWLILDTENILRADSRRGAYHRIIHDESE